MNIKRLVLLSLGVYSLSMPFMVQAADPVIPMTQQEQLQQDRDTQRERNLRFDAERVGTVVSEPALIDVPSDKNGTSFYIKQIQLDGVPKELSFLNKIARKHEQKHVTVSNITNIRNAFQRKLLDKGYVTSQVYIPEQNLNAGTLQFMVMPGRVEDIRYSDSSAHGPWRTAFPVRPGDILNIRDVEQGLEQMKRVSSQSVTMKLLPGTSVGTSIIELSIKQDKPVHGSISFDNSGLESTGVYQGSFTSSFDQVFRANDTFTMSLSGDLSGSGSIKGTRAASLNYVIPHGKDTFSLSFSKSRYHQTIQSNPYDFIYSGKSTTMKAKWNHVWSRTQREKRAFDISISTRHNHRFINDMEIPVQALRTTSMEFGVSNRKYIGNATLYTRLGFQWGIGALGAQPEHKASVAMGGPTSRYHMWLVDVDYRKPFIMGHRPASFTSSFHGQWVQGGKRLYSVDTINIGNRYSIYGFDGEYTLMGDSGWYVRNEVSSVIPRLNTEVYLGLDVGAVYGKSTEALVGRTIAGTALGIRGNYSSGLLFDAFVSTPLYKPQGYHTKKFYSGFTVGYRF
ncbi:MAG: ShlB/FhaC/HecB family hemolysin secretion/activation protein [Veillonella dispar]|uniref:ShlB/FhaC/HecB family hemolysin secretion/activation protein n=1 Tax=Veillonella dispar TaxID=39778 RepID=UPI0026E9D85B|nr:ShlB/FhaC/HecB family hemolysin secretion/activation protein [Veillonella dispar]MBS7065219.1 ShlB/FhaC/HecB family hemolysin secretion/activation protein [Veillonella dispar]MDU7638171.1 ShlB/FhaC/HecB family hemolysin secretion/activation protein [Veillonella dispar]